MLLLQEEVLVYEVHKFVNIMDEDVNENEGVGEWTKYVISLPVDDFDEDDEVDARIAKVEQAKRGRVVRGQFFGI